MIQSYTTLYLLDYIGRTGTWRRKWERLKAGKAMANYPQELA